MGIFLGQFFKDKPTKVLGKVITHNPNTGKLLTDQFGKARAEVRGTLDDVIKGIDTPNVVRFDHFHEGHNLVKSSPKTAQRIKKVIALSKKESAPKKASRYNCSNELQCLGDTISRYNKGISKEEIKVWVTYQVQSSIFDVETIKTNEWGTYYVQKPNYKQWLKSGLVAYDGKEFIPSVLFYSGDIYDRIVSVKTKEKEIVARIGQQLYEKQLSLLEKAKPKALYISENADVKLYLSPFDKIWEDIEITELADGTSVDSDASIGSIFYSNYLAYLSREELTIDKKSASAYEVYSYWINKDRKPRDKSKSAWASIRRNTTIIGTHHFDKFLLTVLSETDKQKISYLWNRKSNNYKDIDYAKIPVGFKINTKFKGGQLSIRGAQREGVAFMNHRGTGIVAYDVGVGKTMTAILGVSDGFEKGLFKRPLVVVPQKVYKKWIAEISGVYAEKTIKKGNKIVAKKGDLIAQGILPHIKINDYDNLGVKNIGSALDELGLTKTVDAFSVTMITYEGLMKIGFNEDTEGNLSKRLKEILSQGESGRAGAIMEQGAEKWIDEALKNTELDIEDMGIDCIIVDEAHNFRNLFMEVKGDIGKDGERESKNFFAGGSGKPSARALKLFMLNAYVHDKNRNRNTFGLTATPFTNRATEIYSMMAHYDYNGLKDFDVYNIAQFCSKYIDESIESTWTASGTFTTNAVIRGYNNLTSLQSMIFRSINYKTGEEANIKRPQKIILPLKNDENGVPLELENIVDTTLKPNDLQRYWLNQITMFASKNPFVREESRLANYYPADSSGNVPGQVLIALNAARAVTFSPYAIRIKGENEYDTSEISAEQFVNNSPKIKYVCACIASVKKHHEQNRTPISGQIIYSDRGIEWFGHIKEYLVEHIGYQDKEVAIFHGGISVSKREKIKEGFLNNDIKIIIGTSTMREGVDLQKHGSVLYNCYLDWNPTDHHQLAGRIWRFGNKFSHVRIVIPLMEDSSDVFTWQKLSEKMSRLNSIWSRSGKTKLFEERELNAEELKKGLINDPKELVRWEIKEKASFLKTEQEAAQSNYDTLIKVGEIKKAFNSKEEALESTVKEALNKPHLRYDVTSAQKEKLMAMRHTDIKSAYRIISAYANLQNQYSAIYTKRAVDEHKKLSKKLKHIEDRILAKENLTLNDDYSHLLDFYKKRSDDLSKELLLIQSDEYFQEKLEQAYVEKRELDKKKKPMSNRIKEFMRLNYLLECKQGIDNCDIYGRKEKTTVNSSVNATVNTAVKSTVKSTVNPSVTPSVKAAAKVSDKKLLQQAIDALMAAQDFASNDDKKSITQAIQALEAAILFA